MSERLLTLSPPPHLMGGRTIRSMNLETLCAMAPAVGVGLYYFGLAAAKVLVLAVASTVLTEYLVCRITGRDNTLGDLHAVVMGLLLGMILPPGAPWWLAVVGGVFAVVVGKMLFGGLGNYPMNPVLIAWAALALSWAHHMSAFYEPGALGEIVASPLMQFKDDIAAIESFELWDLWMGNSAGAIGAVGTLALALGGVYLVLRRIVAWQIPFGVLLGVVVMSLVAGYLDPNLSEMGWEGIGEHLTLAWFHMATGGLMIVAFFLAPEPVTSPMTPWACFLYGLGIGCMTVIVRTWGTPVDGAYYAVLVMNAATPLLDKIRPKVLGKGVASA